MNSLKLDIMEGGQTQQILKLPEDHASPKDKKTKKFFKNSNFYSLITSDSFNKSKFKILETGDEDKKLKFIIPIYHYTENYEDLLIIQTPFIDIKKNINYKNLTKYNRDKNFLDIVFDSNFFDNTILNIFMNYDDEILKNINKKYDNKITCHQNLIKDNNTGEQSSKIKGKLKYHKKLGTYSKLINYNISKKFPLKEEFDLISMTGVSYQPIFDRIFNEKKQVRLLITPITWIDEEKMIYGSYLNILMMEVKYKNAKINSILDQNEISVKNRINKIEI